MLTHWFIVIFGNSGDEYGLKGPATILRRHRPEVPAEFPAADDQAAAARPIILVSGARHEREIVSTRADTLCVRRDPNHVCIDIGIIGVRCGSFYPLGRARHRYSGSSRAKDSCGDSIVGCAKLGSDAARSPETACDLPDAAAADLYKRRRIPPGRPEPREAVSCCELIVKTCPQITVNWPVSASSPSTTRDPTSSRGCRNSTPLANALAAKRHLRVQSDPSVEGSRANRVSAHAPRRYVARIDRRISRGEQREEGGAASRSRPLVVSELDAEPRRRQQLQRLATLRF
jgi:hypothetical protein